MVSSTVKPTLSFFLSSPFQSPPPPPPHPPDMKYRVPSSSLHFLEQRSVFLDLLISLIKSVKPLALKMCCLKVNFLISLEEFPIFHNVPQCTSK